MHWLEAAAFALLIGAQVMGVIVVSINRGRIYVDAERRFKPEPMPLHPIPHQQFATPPTAGNDHATAPAKVNGGAREAA
jgi:hypothetical protein